MSQEQVIVRKPSFVSGNSQDGILKLLDNLEDLGENTVNFMNKAWGMDLEEFHVLINKIRASLPPEFRRATRVVGDSDKIVSDARDEALAMREQAIEESNRVVAEARQMAAKLVERDRKSVV